MLYASSILSQAVDDEDHNQYIENRNPQNELENFVGFNLAYHIHKDLFQGESILSILSATYPA